MYDNPALVVNDVLTPIVKPSRSIVFPEFPT